MNSFNNFTTGVWIISESMLHMRFIKLCSLVRVIALIQFYQSSSLHLSFYLSQLVSHNPCVHFMFADNIPNSLLILSSIRFIRYQHFLNPLIITSVKKITKVLSYWYKSSILGLFIVPAVWEHGPLPRAIHNTLISNDP